jgi:cystathionine beta-lyase/cystathionine gamma-synthase
MTSGGDTTPDNRGAKNAMFGLKGKNHPASDWVRSPEYLKRQSDSHKGSKNWMTGKTVPKEQRDLAGVSEGLVRFSVGIENVEDILNDLKQALDKL